MKREEMTKIITETLRACDVFFDEKIVEMLIEKIQRKMTGKSITCIKSYVWICVRNWAIDQKRKLTRWEKENLKRVLKQEEARKEKEKFEQAKNEFWKTAEKAIANTREAFQENVRTKMEMLYAAIFERVSDAELSSRYPRFNRNLRDQNIRRARKTIRPYTSEILWKVISKSRNAHKN